jgi:predicted Fe-Mo cluster-binding NifX family protein
MRVCITSAGPSLDSEIDPRFGRCQYFLFVDPQSLEMEALENPNIGASGGAGIQSAQFVANKGVETIITGQVGPNAFSTLQAAGMKILVGASGKVRDVLEKYNKGQLTSFAQGPTARAHAGMGMGGGMGRGRGMGQVTPPPTPPAPGPSGSSREDLQALKEESQKLKEQLGSIDERIARLEKTKK